jgi:hypothetical protein
VALARIRLDGAGDGVASFTLIPYLRWANRDDEVTEAIVAGAVGIALGFAIVKFLTKPEP